MLYAIFYILGVMSGLILAVFSVTIILYFKTSIERKLKQTSSKIKRKGEILEPEDPELIGWINKLPNE